MAPGHLESPSSGQIGKETLKRTEKELPGGCDFVGSSKIDATVAQARDAARDASRRNRC